jgi:hypothetical protein
VSNRRKLPNRTRTMKNLSSNICRGRGKHGPWKKTQNAPNYGGTLVFQTSDWADLPEPRSAWQCTNCDIVYETGICPGEESIT